MLSAYNKQKKSYWNNFVAGLALGIVLLSTYYIAGRGLGSSGAITRSTASTMNIVASDHTQNIAYFSRYFSGSENHDQISMNDWLVVEVIGLMLGGLLGSITAGRFKRTVDKGEHISNRQRFLIAFAGGVLVSIGTRLARGCTSGQALSGGATLALGSWAFMLAVFASAFCFALLVPKIRSLWL